MEDPGVDGAEHLLVGRGDRAVAEGLQGEDREGLLDGDADLLDAKEEEGDDKLRGDGGPVVPRVAEHRPEGKGQESRKKVRKREVRRV